MMTVSQLISLAASIVPADLMKDVKRSLRVPQVGPYHKEGPFMDSHLVRVLDALERVARGNIDSRIPQIVRDLMVDAVGNMGLEVCQLYVLLHDLDKATCLTLVYTDDRKVAVTWDKWESMFTGTTDEELDTFCKEKEVAQISYYQAGEQKRSHGKVTAQRLRGREDVPEIVVNAIEEHELAFTFGARGGTNIPLIERMVEGKDSVGIGFTFAVNYADQQGSYREDGQPDMSDFLLMAESYVAHVQYQELVERLETAERLDGQKLEKVTSALRKSTDAFREEDVDVAFERIVEQCKLPEVPEADVRAALATVDGLSAELVEQIVSDMVTTGKIEKDTGRQLRQFNRPVRQALAGIG